MIATMSHATIIVEVQVELGLVVAPHLPLVSFVVAVVPIVLTLTTTTLDLSMDIVRSADRDRDAELYHITPTHTPTAIIPMTNPSTSLVQHVKDTVDLELGVDWSPVVAQTCPSMTNIPRTNPTLGLVSRVTNTALEGDVPWQPRILVTVD